MKTYEAVTWKKQFTCFIVISNLEEFFWGKIVEIWKYIASIYWISNSKTAPSFLVHLLTLRERPNILLNFSGDEVVQSYCFFNYLYNITHSDIVIYILWLMFDKLEAAARFIERKCFLGPLHEAGFHIHIHHPKGSLNFSRVFLVQLPKKEKRKTEIMKLIGRFFN